LAMRSTSATELPPYFWTITAMRAAGYHKPAVAVRGLDRRA
jgi:hypothetical protein